MKQWKLIRSFYSQMRAPCILLFLLMTISLLVLTIGTGYYRYMTYSRTTMVQSGLEEAIYVSYLGVEDAPEDLTDEIKTIQSYPFVQDILYTCSVNPVNYQNNGITIILLPESVIAKLPFFLQTGNSFSNSGLTKENKLQCVAGAPFLKDIKAGEDIQLNIGGSEQMVNMNVVGKLRYPYFHPYFGAAGNITAGEFVSAIQTILVKDTPETRKMLNVSPIIEFYTCASYWIEFKDTATPAEKADFINIMQKNHRVATYEDILKNTDKAVGEAASGALATPLYLVFITTMSFISIAILLLYKKSNQNAIWYLCGCSKRRSYVYASLAIGLICLAACLIPLLLILLYPVWGEYDLLPLGNIYLDSLNIWIILGYLAVVLGLSFLFPFLLQYKASPMDALRRLNE